MLVDTASSEPDIEPSAHRAQTAGGAGARRSPQLSPATLALPDRPSIAVLPFKPVTDDLDAHGVADGITDHVIYALACTHGLFVSGRNSIFTFKHRAVGPREVRDILGVAHLLEGEIGRDDHRVSLVARLVATETGELVFSRRFEGAPDDLFALLGTLVGQVMTAIAPRLAFDKACILRSRVSDDVGIYRKFLVAYANFAAGTEDTTRNMLSTLAAIAKDIPGHPLPLALMSQCFTNLVVQGWSRDISADAAEGTRLARAALDRGGDDPASLMMAAHTVAFLGQDYDTALGLLDRSLALNPNSASTYERSGWVRCYVGDPDSAVEQFRAAKRLSPLDVTMFRFDSGLGLALSMLGRHEEAVHCLKRAIADTPHWTSSHRVIAASFAHLGRQREAEAAVRTLSEIEPGYRVGQALRLYRPSPGRDMLVSGMLKAGIPE